ncbi:hypothetical protein [Dactylosporangium darangshiense]|uniref:DUF218 domain-containing protein n=1 Tax=Dactylosporangium darangshiense TaxID=579108 RepID=A0ABP8D8P5_9ACTN
MLNGGKIARLVHEDELAEYPAGRLLDVMRALTMVLTLPGAAAQRLDAVAVLTGQGETWRLAHAVGDWEARPARRHLLVATTNAREATYEDVTLDSLRGLGLRRVSGVHIQGEAAADTGVQAAWVAAQVRELGITGLALAVSPYHLPRAYLTVLRACEDAGVRIPLLPLPVAVAPDATVPESGASAWDMVAGEMRRIIEYTDRGWVADPELLRRYLAWLWHEHRALLHTP